MLAGLERERERRQIVRERYKHLASYTWHTMMVMTRARGSNLNVHEKKFLLSFQSVLGHSSPRGKMIIENEAIREQKAFCVKIGSGTDDLRAE